MASELASLVQSTHIQHQPDPAHDINPSTAASVKIPGEILPPDSSSELDDHDDDAASHTSASTLSSDIIRPLPRRPSTLTGRPPIPLPDLRFEQTYLASIKNTTSNYQVAYITLRDQVLLPLLQGVGYHLLLSGWRYMNRGTKFQGQTLGARVRKWWWGVNGWKVPGERQKLQVAEVGDFFVAKSGSSLGD